MKKNDIIGCFFVGLFVAIFYLLLILIYPNYLSDDYTIFNLIRKNATLISLNTNERFYLFFRPIAYLTFCIDYYILYPNEVLSKVFSLLFLLSFSCVFYLFIFESKELIRIKIDNIDISLIVLFVSTNAIIVTSVLWVASRNELLMCLFYILTLYVFVKYLATKKYYLIYYIFIFFILSVLSKQQSLHLPILLLLLRYKFNNVKLEIAEKLLFIALFLLMIFVLALNYHNINVNSGILILSLWKKSFWVFISLIYIFLPFAGDLLYNFFIANKSLAFISSIIILIALLIFIKANLKSKYKIIFSAVLFILTLFPVIFVEFTPRVISLSLVIANIIIILNFNIIKKLIVFRFAFILLLAINILFSVLYTLNLKNYSISENKVIEEFCNTLVKYPVNILVISPITDLNDRLNYTLRCSDCSDSVVFSVPIYFTGLRFYNLNFAPANTFNIDYKNGLICINSNSLNYSIDSPARDTFEVGNVGFVICGKIVHDKKFLQEFFIKPLDYLEFYKKFNGIVYLNGNKWNEIRFNKKE